MHPATPPTSRLPAATPLLVALVVLAIAGYFAWRHFSPDPASAPMADVPERAATPASPAAQPPAPDPATALAIEHPVEAEAGASAPMPALADADAYVNERLTGLLGRTGVLTFLQVDGFVRRAVATVDNLAREQAPVMVWPVNPTPERFSTQRSADGQDLIHPDNARRYAPLVQMIEAVDTGAAVGLYRSLYPLFQQAYEEAGFPGRYFNDRLVQVLDHLIATPVPTGPLAVQLVEVKGTVPSLRPWVRYEFVDPALESQSAGRKMLMRVGPDHQRRLMAKLQDIRQRVAKP